jgi:hypothetical protein
MNNQNFKKLSDTTETSWEIFAAIHKLLLKNKINQQTEIEEECLLAEWDSPESEQTIIDEAAKITNSDKLFWGCSGVVWKK